MQKRFRMIYAETPEQMGVVRDMSSGGQKMMRDSPNTEGKAFFRKQYIAVFVGILCILVVGMVIIKQKKG